jgi:hypothetical protein
MSQTIFTRTVAARRLRRTLTLALFALLGCVALGGTAAAQSITPGSPDLVISQVYTRGGEPGATFRNDFVEVFNRGNTTVNLADYSLQVLVNVPNGVAPVAATVRFVSTGIGFPVAPGKYVLYEFGTSGNNGAPLPPAESTLGGLNLNLPATTGRVALIKGLGLAPAVAFAQYGCPVGVDAALGDFFSYGAATCVEGGGSTNFPAPSATTAAVRNTGGCADADETVADFTTAAPTPRNSQTAAAPCNLTALANTLQFETDTVTVNEGAGFAEIFVTRTGDASAAAQFQYATTDDTANERNDYTTALGTVTFPAGVSRTSFRVLITDDARPESDERFTVALNYPTSGLALGTRHIARVTITDNDAAAGANPVDQTDFFVRQHYADFLSRTPDTPGFNFWTGEINGCGADAQCREVKRVNVSAAFFLSIEFQDSGYFAYRAYKAAFPDNASRQRGFPLYRELFRDAQQIAGGIVVGQSNWEAQLEANKLSFAQRFVTRPEFHLRYPLSLSPAQFVDALNGNAGNPFSQAERDREVNDLTASGDTGDGGRGLVFKHLLDDEDFKRNEFNRAFVLMEYFGYLRRFPTDPPDMSFQGYDFWLGKLNQFNGNYIEAEMVKAFITSDEYRQRFAQ